MSQQNCRLACHNWTMQSQKAATAHLPSKHEAFTQCSFNVGPPSPTLAQHWNSIGWMPRACWASMQILPVESARQNVIEPIPSSSREHTPVWSAFWEKKTRTMAPGGTSSLKSLIFFYAFCGNELKPAETGRLTNVGFMLGQRRRRWPNIKLALITRLVLSEKQSSCKLHLLSSI